MCVSTKGQMRGTDVCGRKVQIWADGCTGGRLSGRVKCEEVKQKGGRRRPQIVLDTCAWVRRLVAVDLGL